MTIGFILRLLRKLTDCTKKYMNNLYLSCWNNIDDSDNDEYRYAYAYTDYSYEYC